MEVHSRCSNCNWQTPEKKLTSMITMNQWSLWWQWQWWWSWEPPPWARCPSGPQRTWYSQSGGAQTLWKNAVNHFGLFLVCQRSLSTHWKAAFFLAKSWQALWPRVALYWEVNRMSGGMSKSTDLRGKKHKLAFKGWFSDEILTCQGSI